VSTRFPPSDPDGEQSTGDGTYRQAQQVISVGAAVPQRHTDADGSTDHGAQARRRGQGRRRPRPELAAHA